MVDKRVSVRDRWTTHHERLTPIGRRISHGRRVTYADMAHARCEFITFYTSASNREIENIALTRSSVSRVFHEVRDHGMLVGKTGNTSNQFTVSQYSNRVFTLRFIAIKKSAYRNCQLEKYLHILDSIQPCTDIRQKVDIPLEWNL